MSSIDSENAIAAAMGPRQRRWTFWRFLSWAFLSLLLLLIIAAAYVWQNRYTFLEDTLKDVLAEQGLDAELFIKDINKQSAVLGNITIAADGMRVFSAQSLAIEYDWRDALNGRMKRIELTGAELALTVDETGKIIDGWMPASNPDSEVELPPQGVHLNDSRVKLQSPYGLVNAKGNMTFLSFEDIKASFEIDPSRFSFGALEVSGGGQITARIRPGENAVKASLDFTDMAHPLAQLSSAAVTADVTFDLVDGQSQVTGPLALSFAELKSNTLAAKSGRLYWDGGFAVRPDSAAIREADGKWSGDVKAVSYSDAAGRATLSEALTLNAAMSAAPITTHFADSLTESVKALLLGADVKAAGEFLRLNDKAEVKLTGPLSVTSKSAQATLTPLGTDVFYDYNRETKTLNIAANASLSGARSVRLSDMRLGALSPNGLSITNVSDFSATAILEDEWRAASPEGLVRLAPLTAKARYVNQGPRRDMQLQISELDYDGPLPGGYAAGLGAAGTLFVDLRGEGLKTSFTPLSGTRLSAARFETSAGWTAANARFDLITRGPFYERAALPDKASLAARLENVTSVLTETATGRKLDVSLSAVDVNTAITGTRQNWTLGLFGAEVKTDDFGGIGTVVGAQQAVLLAGLSPESAPQINLQTDAARVRTDQLSTQNMKIALTGTPQKFHLDFGGETYATAGLVKFADETLPQLPLRGGLDYDEGEIVGNALTVLPKAEDADIDIKFRMKDGEGTAKINIARLTFTPRGFQPQNLVSALQGKIAEVAGAVSAEIDVVFAPDTPLKSFGRATLNNLDFGTLPGPFRGVSTQIEFASVFPLVSSGVQRMTVDSFNPGVDLVNGVIEYELVDGGIEILSAKWPLANGFISVDPTLWKFDAPENRVVLRIDDVSVGAFLGGSGSSGLTVTGDIVGTIPVVVAGVDVRIEQGSLGIENGGLIQYRARELTSIVDLIPEEYVTLKDYQQFKAFQKSADPSENAGKDLAFTALRNFEYKSLSVKLDGPLDGEIEVNVRFLGRNPKILAGTEFDFNVTIIGELVNLVRSLKPDSSVDRIKGYMELYDYEGADVELNDLGLGDILPPELQ